MTNRICYLSTSIAFKAVGIHQKLPDLITPSVTIASLNLLCQINPRVRHTRREAGIQTPWMASPNPSMESGYRQAMPE
ncbi:hypothetical protein [Methyloglobulus sp.]|uniref:hypothetical protein n=1 Tax=Methyloglobulus sp. TaxID=2518622 RepID=UPI003988CD20